MLHFLQFSVIVISFHFISLGFTEPGDIHTVTIYNGKVSGLEAVTETDITPDQQITFYSFRGIPYAKPPTGFLRFRAPKPAENWTDVRDGTYNRSQCLSPSGGSEDCLFVNVYTPQLYNITTLLPVIVFIHGGGFYAGSGNIGLHGADRFMRNNGVVFVTINYRLGVFGFLSTEDDIVPGNYGIKDQVLALKWVNENIEVFGGDPNQVTIMGESAGAASVHFLIQAKRARGLFTKAISESGTSLVPWTVAPNARTFAFRVGLANGIWTVSSKTLVEGLRKVDANKLCRTTVLPAFLDLWDPLNGLPMAPVKENYSPEAVITDDSYELLLHGRYNPVTLLSGFNSLEGRVAATLPWYTFLLSEQYNLFPSTLTPKDMHASQQGAITAGNAIKSIYFGNYSFGANNYTIDYLSDDGFVRGIVKTAKLMSRYDPVYLYRFDFIGGVQHSSFFPEGVSHAEELQFLFLDNTTMQVTDEAKLCALRMTEMWINFAKTGNPTPQTDDVIDVLWPIVNSTDDENIHYFNIDSNLTAEINPEKNLLDFWDNLYFEYGYPPYNTY